MNLDKLRSEIDILDVQIISLLGKRFELARQIGREKKKMRLRVLDQKRESFILEKNTKLAEKEKLSKNFIEQLFRLIFAESKSEQQKV